MSKKLVKLKPIKAIRMLTAMFNPEHAVTILALVNLLSRHMDKDQNLCTEFLLDRFSKAGIELDLNEGPP